MKKVNERALVAQVKEMYGVGVPQWRVVDRHGDVRTYRVYSKAEQAEMAALIDWLAQDEEFWSLCKVYFGYCDALSARGYGAKADRAFIDDRLTSHPKVARQLATGVIEYIYHDMCCNPAHILDGTGEGYWIYLDKEYLDVSHLKVGSALLNCDEVWAVVSDTVRENIAKMHEREAKILKGGSCTCDCCGKPIYDKRGTRFDMYENLLHCADCAKACTHWKHVGKTGKKGAKRGA